MNTKLRTGPAQIAAAKPAGGAGRGRLRRIGTTIGIAAYRFLLPLGVAAGVVAIWQWATWHFEIRALYLPSPWSIRLALEEHWQRLLEHAWVTVYQTGLGFAIGAVGGLLLAALLASSTVVERATLPLIIALNAIPKVALAPLLVIWLGFGGSSKVTLAALICFFPILIAAMAGLTATPAEFHEMARALSASRWQTFYKIRIPWALPQVFVGLKLGITLAVIGTVVAQLASPTGGLGMIILLATQSTQTPTVFAAIFLLMILSLVLFYSVVVLERLLLPWARETAAARA